MRRLGRGGMGAVYLAVDEHHRAVALKVIAGVEAREPAARERFAREIRALCEIRHANVVRLHQAGEVDGVPYLVLERVRGHDLARIGTQPWPVAVALGRQLAHATAAVHARGWIHRDLKRSNAIVSDRGFVTLIDFGLAKQSRNRDRRARAERSTDDRITEGGTVLGTPRYLAPELRRGLAATPATDVYALGLILHELVGGSVDPDGHLATTNRDLAPELLNLLARMLAVDPRRRPSALVVAAALDGLPAARTRFHGHAGDSRPTWPLEADRRPTFGADERGGVWLAVHA